MKTKFVTMLLSILVVGCANPLNQITSNRYSETCFNAHRNGNLDVAEEACYRALVNVDIGNLGDAQRGDRMYDLARIKRQLTKFDEAEKLFIEALNIEEKQPAPSNIKIGRRAAELAILYAQTQKIEKGIVYAEKLIPISNNFKGKELKTIAVIFQGYSNDLRKLGNNAKANIFEVAAKKLEI